jgi:hypothetical protein
MLLANRTAPEAKKEKERAKRDACMVGLLAVGDRGQGDA